VTVTVDRARGCLAGQAAGDALGAPLEGLSRDRIRRYCGEVRGYLDTQPTWPGRLGRAHLRGLYTDDTQQALLIADVLVESRGFDPEAARRKYLEMARPVPGLPRGAHRSTRGNFRAALDRMAAGTPALEAGVTSAGNGAAMRVAPIGLWYAADPDGLRRAAIQASLQTHTDARGISAAVAVAYLVGHLAANAVPGPGEALAALRATRAFTQEAEAALSDEYGLGRNGHGPLPCFSAGLLVLEGLWEAPVWDVMRAIVIEANRQQPERPVTSPSDRFAGASVTTAIYLALQSPSFQEAVVRAVNLGGDTDTLGAITGALAGARWGAGAIPQPWLDGLANLPGLLSRADALVGGRKAAGEWQDLPVLERRLSLALERRREGW
jgi:ADP-ribosyl-[dinitrogen reductase] hydrolase